MSLTVMKALEKRLQPKYVGWKDQYLAVLYAMGIHPDTPWDELALALSTIKLPQRLSDDT